MSIKDFTILAKLGNIISIQDKEHTQPSIKYND